METKQDLPWQQSAGALVFLIALLAIACAYSVWISWPSAVSGNQGAVENLITTFGFVALALAGLAAGYKKPKLVTIGASVWAVSYYFSSLILDDMVHGHNVGTAIRVGALAALAFVLALSYIHRKAISHPHIYEVLQKHYGGVYKRIDENRELLELLQEKAPDFLQQHFWVEGWLQSQDGFLNDLARSIPADARLPRFNVVEGKFPRPWPGKK